MSITKSPDWKQTKKPQFKYAIVITPIILLIASFLVYPQLKPSTHTIGETISIDEITISAVEISKKETVTLVKLLVQGQPTGSILVVNLLCEESKERAAQVFNNNNKNGASSAETVNYIFEYSTPCKNQLLELVANNEKVLVKV